MNNIKIVKINDDGTFKISFYDPLFKGTDLDGDFFDSETDFGLDIFPSKNKPLLYNHGYDYVDEHGDKIAVPRKIGRVTMETVDDFGLFVEADVEAAKEYDEEIRNKIHKYLKKLIDSGDLGNSSQALYSTADGQYAKDMRWYWKTWHEVEHSLTRTPAEPRTFSHMELIKSISKKRGYHDEMSRWAETMRKTWKSQPEFVTKLAEMFGLDTEEEPQTLPPVVTTQNTEKNDMEPEILEALKTMQATASAQAKEQAENLKTFVTESITKIEDFVKENTLKTEDGPEAKPILVKVQKDELDKQATTYKHVGEQLADIIRMHGSDERAQKAKARINKVHETAKATGMSTLVPEDGGALLQNQFAQEIERQAAYQTLFYKECVFTPIDDGKDGLVWLEIDDQDQSVSSGMNTAGGVMAYRRQEAEQYTSDPSKIKWNKYTLGLEDMIVIYRMTRELSINVKALGALATEFAAEAFGKRKDYEAFYGTGSGQMRGVIGHPATAAVTRTTASRIKFADISSMFINMDPRWITGAYWYCNPEALAQAMTITHNDTSGADPVWLPPNGIADAPYGFIMGRPVRVHNMCQTLSTVGDFMFLAPKAYRIIGRGNSVDDTEYAESIHVYYLYNENALRFVQYNNGRPRRNTTVTPLHGSHTRSGFVTLSTK